MSFLSKLKKKTIDRLVDYLNGKKTALGATSLLLWVTIYAMPAFGPDYNFIVKYATEIRDFLLANGVVLDNSLFNTGVAATVIGLLDKFRKMKQGKS